MLSRSRIPKRGYRGEMESCNLCPTSLDVGGQARVRSPVGHSLLSCVTPGRSPNLSELSCLPMPGSRVAKSQGSEYWDKGCSFWSSVPSPPGNRENQVRYVNVSFTRTQVWGSSTHNAPSASSSHTTARLSFLLRALPGNVQARAASPRLLRKKLSHGGAGWGEKEPA